MGILGVVVFDFLHADGEDRQVLGVTKPREQAREEVSKPETGGRQYVEWVIAAMGGIEEIGQAQEWGEGIQDVYV